MTGLKWTTEFLSRDGRIALLALAMPTLLIAANVSAQTNEWEGNFSSNWFFADNWSEEEVPGAGVPVRIDIPTPAAVVDNAVTAAIGNFFVGSAQFGQLIVRNGGTLNSSSTNVGFQQGSEGYALVTGDGTTWNNPGILRIGTSGQGELRIEEGAQMLNGNTARIGKWGSSEGSVIVRDPGSSWIIDGTLEVARQGDGTLLIESQGSVSSLDARIAENSGTTGSVIVTGMNSSWASNGAVLVGHSGSGSLTISDGAAATNVSTGSTRVGNLNGSLGELLITGTGSILDTAGSFSVGHFGGSSGQATITNGGHLIGARPAGIGVQADSQGTIELSGAGSSWQLPGSDLNVGQSGTGSLSITEGASLSNRSTIIGTNSSGMGEITLSGQDAQLVSSGFMRVGDAGNGTFTLGANARLVVTGNIGIGFQAGSVGHFIIGDGINAAIVDAPQFWGGSGDAMLTFDHAAALYHFTIDGTAQGATPSMNNEMDLVHAGPGTTVIGGSHSYTGETTINAGTLQMDGDFLSPVLVNEGATLSGRGTIDAPVEAANNATLSPGDVSAGTLTTGSLTLNSSSQLVFGLGAPGTVGSEVNDLIVVNGDLVLDGQLEVLNLGGFDEGTYTLITYTGSLTDNTLEPVSLPGDAKAMIDTATVGEIRLIVADFFEPQDEVFADRFED